MTDGENRVLGSNVDAEWILHTGGGEYHRSGKPVTSAMFLPRDLGALDE